MHTSSFILSLILHIAFFALLLFAPTSPPVDLNRPVYQLSLVEGAPGGEDLPSPVLGHRPPSTGKQVNSTVPEAMPAATPAPAPDAPAIPNPESLQVPEPSPEKTAEPAPLKEEKAEAPKEKKPEPKPEKQPDPVNIPKPEVKPEPKPEDKKEAKPEKKPEPKPEKKAEPKVEKKSDNKDGKTDGSPTGKGKGKNKSGKDDISSALADLKRQTSKGGGSSASRALADLEKQVGPTGIGGGGGSGDGPGGGGIYDVYVAQVVLAVQPNWHMPSFSRKNFVVQVRIKLDKKGKVLDCSIERSSGRPEYDASAINAVIRTEILPPPPTPAQQDLLINFNSEMFAR